MMRGSDKEPVRAGGCCSYGGVFELKWTHAGPMHFVSS